MAHNGTLTKNQRRAIDALMSCKTVTAAAEKAGVGRRTIYNWMGDRGFKTALRDEIDAISTETLSRYAAGTSEALDVIYEIMLNQNKAATRRGAATRLRAATTWLERADKLAEDTIWRDRLIKLWEVNKNGSKG